MLFDNPSLFLQLYRASTASFILICTFKCIFFVFNTAFNSKEINFDCIYLIFLFLSAFDICWKQENVFSSSFVVDLNLCFSLKLEECYWLPELTMLVSSLFSSQPLFIINFCKLLELLFSNMEPRRLICSKNQSLIN